MISFPVAERPDVSIVMVVYGGWEWVAEALRAITENTPPSYEVVIVDNASPDGTGELMESSVVGATIVRNDRNVGFGAGANLGALHAVGRHLFFLNSDAFVQPGWLSPLLEVLDADPRAGAVAPCLLDPDGTLQEAGGLLGADGFAVQHGLGADPGSSAYRFRRRADFASAAALLVRRRDFQSVGGFNPAYGLGYFEDVDLCLELWEKGLATAYEPRSRVVHLRGASTNFDESQSRALLSHVVFLRRWGDRLALRTTLSDFDKFPHRLAASRDARSQDRVAVLEPRGMSAPGSVTEEIASWWPDARVTLLAVDDAVGPSEADDLLTAGIEIGAEDGDLETWLRQLRHHYTIVVLHGTLAFERYDSLLRQYQPSALRVLELQGSEEPTAERLTAMLASSAAVICATDAQRARVESVGVAMPVFCRETPPAETLPVAALALAHAGLAPPLLGGPIEPRMPAGTPLVP